MENKETVTVVDNGQDKEMSQKELNEAVNKGEIKLSETQKDGKKHILRRMNG